MSIAKTNNGLTEKQEAACQAFIKNKGDKSAAYRSAYNTSKMKTETINRNAHTLFKNNKLATRIAELQENAKKRNNLEIDDLLQSLKNIIEFNPKCLFNEDGSMKKITELSDKEAKCLTAFDVDVNKLNGQILSIKTKVKSDSRLEAIEKVMKHLGGYEKDNSQKQPKNPIIVTSSDISKKEIDKLING